MVDIVDSKSTALKACGFESHLPYHLKRTQIKRQLMGVENTLIFRDIFIYAPLDFHRISGKIQNDYINFEEKQAVTSPIVVLSVC